MPVLKPPGLDEHDLHAVARDLDSQRVGQRFEGMLRAGVVTRERHRREAGDRRDVDDAAAAIRAHRRQREPRQAHRRMDHRLEQGTRLVVADVLDCARDPVAGVVDEAVEVEAGHHVLARGRVGDIEQHGVDFDPRGSGGLVHDLRLLRRAHRADRVEAALRDLDDGCEPDARVRARREDGLVRHREARRRRPPPSPARRCRR